jgi:superfamily I DNA/RNA helicase
VEKARSLAEDEGLDVLFTCYNRALADHVGDALGYRGVFDVFSFHQLCFRAAQRAGRQVLYQDYRSSRYYDVELPSALLEAIDRLGPQYDAIIVDEGQDFRAEWWEVLPRLLHDPNNGILYAFFDNNQRVYPDRAEIPIEMAPYVLNENCRNTRRIFRTVAKFCVGDEDPVVLGPEGLAVQIIEYAGERRSRARLRKMLHHLLTENRFKPNEVAVLTARGTKSSAILGRRLDPFQLTDELPLKIGEVFATTVRRFKGLDRPAIVLCEIDGTLTRDEAEAMMYVGTSRAKAYLAVLVDRSAPARVKESLL